jgi:hypothetical protein
MKDYTKDILGSVIISHPHLYTTEQWQTHKEQFEKTRQDSPKFIRTIEGSIIATLVGAFVINSTRQQLEDFTRATWKPQSDSKIVQSLINGLFKSCFQRRHICSLSRTQPSNFPTNLNCKTFAFKCCR